MARRSLDIPAAAQRSIRFLVGIGIILWELTLHDGGDDPNWQTLLVGTAFAGLPIANIIDEIRTLGPRPKDPPAPEVVE